MTRSTVGILLAVMAPAIAIAEPAPPSAPAAPTPPAIAAAEPDRMQQMVCRKDKETGSLVKTKKTCHTRAQWAYIDDVNQSAGRDLVDNNRGRPSGN